MRRSLKGIHPGILAGSVVALLAAVSCESGGVRMTAPKGADAFARFKVIGGSLAMGVRSDGVIAESQATSWAAILAARAGASFTQPTMRSPGCTPPLVAPLILGRRLSGSGVGTRDSSCAGTSNSLTLPGDNLAMAGATAWAALYLSPKMVAAAPAQYDVGDRRRYPLVLGNSQSQVTALLVQSPQFVGIELGLGEVVRAALSGLVTPATSYGQVAPWTLMPAALFEPVFHQIADSVARTGAKAVVLSVPRLTTLPAFRTAAAVWAERVVLATYGVTVQGDCATSPNLLHVGELVPARAIAAIAAGAAQSLACTDVPGAADRVLTPAEVTAIDAVVVAMNAMLSQAAAVRGWAYANLDNALTIIAGPGGSYSANVHLTCTMPFGTLGSLDGIYPSAAGQALIADVVAHAVNEKYGWEITVAGTPFDLRVNPCS